MKHLTAIVFVGILLFFACFSAQGQTSGGDATAKLVFFRASDDGGRAYSLTSQNQELVKLKKGEKFEQTLAPGTYYYMADPSTKQVFRIDLVAGQTVYVKASRNGSFFDGQPTLQISTAQEFQQTMAAAD